MECGVLKKKESLLARPRVQDSQKREARFPSLPRLLSKVLHICTSCLIPSGMFSVERHNAQIYCMIYESQESIRHQTKYISNYSVSEMGTTREAMSNTTKAKNL